MSKVLSRKMFNGPRPTANGTGITAYFSNGGLADSETFKNMFTQYKDVLSSQLAPEKSYEELLAQRMKILGPEDPESARNYALMQLGGKIASTPGGLGVALGAGLPEYASVMQKDEAEQRQLQRAAAGSALDALTQQQNTRQSVGIEAAKSAFSEAALAAREAAKSKADNAIAVIKDNFDRHKEDNAAKRAAEEELGRNTRSAAEIEASDNRAFNVLAPIPFVVKDSTSPSGVKIIMGTRTKNGTFDSKGLRIPSDAVKVDDAYVTKMLEGNDPKVSVNVQVMGKDGKLGDPFAAIQKGPEFFDAATGDKIKAPFKIYDAESGRSQTSASSSYVVVDPNSPYGIKEVIGFQDSTTGETFYMSNNNKVVFDSSTAIKGSLKDQLSISMDDTTVTTKILFGPKAGQNVRELKQKGEFTSGQAGAGETPTGEAPTGGAPVEEKTGNVTPKKPVAIGAITGEGSERYFVKTDSTVPTVKMSNMSSQQLTESQTKIDSGEQLLRNMGSLLKAIPKGTGPEATIESVSTNYVAPFVPKSFDSLVQYLGTEQARREMDLARQAIRQAFSLSSRFPIGELAIIDDIVERPGEFFANPEAAMARMQTLIRFVRNSVEWEKAKLEERPASYIEPIPTGTENDPFPYKAMGYLQELEAKGTNLNGVFYEVIDPNTGKKYLKQYGKK